MKDMDDSKTIAFSSPDHAPSPSVRKPARRPSGGKTRLFVLLVAATVLLLVGVFLLLRFLVFSPSAKETEITLSASEIHEGKLILMNAAFPCRYPAVTLENIDAYHKANGISPCYSLRNDGLQLDRDTLLAFDRMMTDYAAATGGKTSLRIRWAYEDRETVEKDLAEGYADYRDHALGTVLVLDEGEDEVLTDASLHEKYPWIEENAYRYGFISRYPARRSSHTGVTPGQGHVHLRYVGVEHAGVMEKYDLSLEEYLDLICTNYRKEPLVFTANDGKTYEIFYVSCPSDRVTVTVPADKTCRVSGNNLDGFILSIF